ncbi:hypothetical protein SAMN05444722_1162 [Rhodovulum sp. ES.010]|uniref:DUF5333 domain-containing protein n=1 Tax=Rhodovulum sp. ES.010 TaxID=1882821 RepID=UPI0009265AC0|nr:DUF5333 domain-containing protein [Rhodovulum sp. ES.010]SIO27837.1 hypothetical protein SAMN05444722_1162 [Rhodovulum sp. ES.010]
MRLVLTAALAALLTAGAADAAVAKPHLRDNAEINRGLTAIAIADMIRKNCSMIEPRLFRAYGFMRELKRRANAAGYSDAEIEAYVTDKAEKRRVEESARRWLAAQGVTPGQGASYCPVGRGEIERNSQVGVLLREK